jgi:diadenosine tetraphosphate (Ap4A) HIT family hydrolase
MTSSRCPFCAVCQDCVIDENEHALAVRDAFPVSLGHTLIVLRRHSASWFSASADERLAILTLLDRVRGALDAEMAPTGYNIGVNDGEAAGQTIMHLHVHLIPRFTGDVDDPAGGVRFVIPQRGNYRSPGRIPKAHS